MRTAIKYVVRKTYQPLLEKWLSRTRQFSLEGISLEIPPEVFHPGFFPSTRLLLRHVRQLPLKGKRILEPGAGSGLISFFAARQGAMATATDINPIAIGALHSNAWKNKLSIRIIGSDLFDNLSPESFDIIAINPPYYKKNPTNDAERAWYCGENGEYFSKLFSGIGDFMDQSTIALMVLCDGCDLEMIHSYANKNRLRMNCMKTYKSIMEHNYIFRIEKIEADD